MLVCLREIDKAELSDRYRRTVSTQHLERYYSLYTNETSATIVDVVDSRARKTFNFDVLTRSTAQLQEEVVEPLLATVLTPYRASQAVVVVDGHAGHRRSTLLDPVDGLLARTAQAAIAHPDVASVSVSAVTLEDHNTLTDVMPERGFEAAVGGGPTILEDTREQFTSVEDAHYTALDCEATWQATLLRLVATFSELKHQIYSFIFAFHESTGLPNTTMQFVSFTVNEVARGMKSSRHAVSSAAALLECRSPTLTFSATKLLYLLKPTLLGQQPGAWVACLSPVSLLEAAEQETFQEAFAVAQTAARLYSSRIATLNTSMQIAGGEAPRAALVEGLPEDGDSTPDAAAAAAAVARPPPPAAAAAAQREGSAPPRPTRDGPDSAAASGQHHLVDTPAAPAPPYTAPPPLAVPQSSRSTPLTDSSALDASAAGDAASPAPARRVSQGSCAVQKEAPPPRESIQRGTSEERSAMRYEMETYRAVMERAMGKLRAEMRDCAAQLQTTKEDVRRQKHRSRELHAELEAMRSSYDTSVHENDELRRELQAQQEAHERQLHVEEERLASRGRLTGAASTGTPRAADDGTTRALRNDVALLEARVAELTELVSLHQGEIAAHVAKERSYRQRILDLEAALREKERDAVSAHAAVKEARRAAAAAANAHANASAAGEAAAAQVPSSRASHTSSAIAREDLRGLEERASEMEYRLRDALDALQREQTQRMQLEHLMRRREREEVVQVAPAPPPAPTETLVRNLQNTYESRLQELKAEMSDFRAELEQHVVKPSSSRVDASSYAATPVNRASAAAAASAAALSPIPDAMTTRSARVRDEASSAACHGGTSMTTPSPSQPPRLRRTQSFEEFMQEEPRYELHRASFLRRRPPPPP